MRRLFACLFFTVTLMALPLSATGDHRDVENGLSSSPELTLSPAACFIDEQMNSCELSVRVQWQRMAWPPFCLYHEDNPLPFYCGEGDRNDAVTLSVNTAHSFAVIWRAQATQQVIDRIEFIVTTDENSRRQRRRHPWSIF